MFSLHVFLPHCVWEYLFCGHKTSFIHFRYISIALLLFFFLSLPLSLSLSLSLYLPYPSSPSIYLSNISHTHTNAQDIRKILPTCQLNSQRMFLSRGKCNRLLSDTKARSRSNFPPLILLSRSFWLPLQNIDADPDLDTVAHAQWGVNVDLPRF